MAIDARAFASTLADADDAALTRLFRARGIAPDVAWRDVFDAADALLAEQSIRHALGQLAAPGAAALHGAVIEGRAVDGDDTRAGLVALRLIDDAGEPYPSVADVVRTAAAPVVIPRDPAPQTDSAAAAERALTTVAAVTELLLLSYAHPVTRIGTGAIGVAERRRLVECGVVVDPDDAEETIRIAVNAGLIAESGREWLVTPAARSWLQSENRERWFVLADAFMHELPAGIVGHDGLLAPQRWTSVLPWNTEWLASTDERLRGATMLGLIDPASETSTVWARTQSPDLDALSAHWPREVTQVFLQNDLTVIAPGPLAPTADLRLRAMAVRESHAQASTYRFSAESIRGALSRGESAESITDFLSALSLTGIPQPLSYLVNESARRHGDVRVSDDRESGRTRISARTAAVRDTLLVDQALRPLGLVADGEDLISRVARDAVALALADAHYAVAAVSADGAFEPLRPGRVADIVTPARIDHTALIHRLRASANDDADGAWLRRELEVAVRDRAVLTVTVTLPDGSTRDFTLEATGIGGGRLRGRDRAADVERTLPLSHITDVSPVDG